MFYIRPRIFIMSENASTFAICSMFYVAEPTTTTIADLCDNHFHLANIDILVHVFNFESQK